jgi:hypothetical protein
MNFDSPAVTVIVAVILIAVVVITIQPLRERHIDWDKPGRKLKVSGGKLASIGDVERDIPARFAGKGTWSSKPITLEPGEYRLLYQFSSGVPVRVGLVSSFDGEDETLLIKSGSGVEGFGVSAGGRYIFEIQPADESAEWKIEYQHLTRFGTARDDDEGLDDQANDSA